VTVAGAPGLFDSASGSMSYQTANPGCVPPYPISGARVPPSARLAFPVKQVGPYTYRGTLYMDLLKDEDYSGLGVCHWKMAVADLSLRYHGNTFVSALDGEEIRAGRQAKVYFSKADYRDTSQNPMAAFEVPKDKAAYAATHPELFFSVIVSAKQISQ